MKKTGIFYLLALLFIFPVLLHAQQVQTIELIQAEYFIDNDPGAGNATPLSAINGNFTDAFNTVIATGLNLSAGNHTINIRVKDYQGNWSPVFTSVISVQSLSTIRLTQAEYFIDTDPGQGSATAMLAFSGNFNDAFNTVIANGLNISSGNHTINIRVKDSLGNWSPLFTSVISVQTLSIIRLTQAEYFLDTDPGQGNASPMLAFSGNFNDAFNTIIANGLNILSGNHTINIRVKDSLGNWSPLFTSVISVQTLSTIRLTQAEYFLDTDPGQGNASPMLAFSGNFNDAFNTVIANGLNISSGNHTINIRVKDSLGNWSPLFTSVICVQTLSTIRLTHAEYFIDTDPGQGNGAAMLAFNGNFNDAFNNVVANGITIASGNHTINVRVKDTTGIWSAVFSSAISVGCEPPAISNTGGIAICQGNSTTLTASAGTSYHWNTGEITQSVTKNTAGNYCVTVTNANGCSGIACQAITVNLDPTPSITPNGNTTFCSGGSVLLDAGSYTSFQWSTEETTETITAISGNTYTVTVTNNYGCTGTASQLITVNPNPTPTASNNSIGNIINLFSSGGYTYFWSGPPSFTSTLQNPSITNAQPNNSGTYTVTATFESTGCTATATTNVVIASNFSLYGMTQHGGSGGEGVLFHYNIPAGTVVVDYNFPSGGNGPAPAQPLGSLMQASNGKMYGMASAGGTGGYGALFEFDPVTGIFTKDYDFLGNSQPSGSLIQANDGNLYGMTEAAGTYGSGTIFKFQLPTNQNPLGIVTIVHNFNEYYGEGHYPLSGLFQASDGLLYGATTNGGWDNGYADGTFFQFNPVSMTYTVLTTFDISNSGPGITNGDQPQGNLIEDNGILYGMTLFGGTNNLGILYEYNLSTGIVSVDYNMGATGDPNANPEADLLQVGSKLYGLTNSTGTIFDFDPITHVVNTDYNFNNNPNFPELYGSLMQATDGKLYGLTRGPGYGTIFDFNPSNSAFTLDHTFNGNGTEGAGPLYTTFMEIIQPCDSPPLPVITANGATTFCNGGNVVLNAGTYTSYNWNTGATTSVLTATTSGTYSVTISDSKGCFGETSQTVTVNSNPTPVITPSGSTTFCLGGSVVLNIGTYTSYHWSTGANTSSITVSASGTFRVTVTDVNGCTGVSSPTGVTVNPIPTNTNIIVSGSVTFCQGGSATLYAEGTSNSSFINTYLWSNGANTESITVTTGNIYTVTPTNSYGCTGVSAFQVITENMNPTPVITADGPTSFCQGGSVTLDADVYESYYWNDGNESETDQVSYAGDYSVTVYDSHGCHGTASIEVTVNPNPTPVITPNGPTTFDQGGNVGLDAGVYSSYIWSNGATVETIGVTTGGEYSVTVTNGNGCTGVAYITVNEVLTVTITANTSATLCAGNSVTLDAGGPYDYYGWSNGATTRTITVYSAGEYTVYVGDDSYNTGSATQTVTVNSNPTPTVSANGQTTFCQGGSVTLDAGSYSSYNWSNGSNSESITADESNNYIVTVTDINGCTGTTSQYITVNPNPTPDIYSQYGSGFCIDGGDLLYADLYNSYASYSWNTGSTSNYTYVNSVGNYCVTVTEFYGCTGVSCITEKQAPIPIITGPTSICDGTPVTLDADGGPFTSYDWNTGENTETITTSVGGGHYVTVTSANGCSNEAGIYINSGNSPSPNITPDGPITFCNGDSVNLDAGFYDNTSNTYYVTYIWSTGDVIETINATDGGTYCVTVTDYNGCTGVTCIDITVDTPTPAISGSLIICGGGSETIDAGAGYSSYTWNTSDVTETTTATYTDTYTVTVTDANGCSGTGSIDITNYPSNPSVITGPVGICSGGSGTLDATGGTYTAYSWSTGDITEIINITSGGTFYVTVTEDNGCTDVSNIYVYPQPTVAIEQSNPTDLCFGSNSILKANPSEYSNSYLWSTGDITSSITVTSQGDYSVTITGYYSGCTATSTITVTSVGLTMLTGGPTTFCQGGEVVLYVDIDNFVSYSWSNNSTNWIVYAQSSGTYCVTVTDLSGCTASTCIDVFVNPNPIPVITVTSGICGVSETLDAGGPFASYDWYYSGEITESITAISGGYYYVTVTTGTGANACQASSSIEISPQLSVIFYQYSDFCNSSTNIAAYASENSSYLWSTGETTQTISVTSPAVYSVTVTSNYTECTASATTTVGSVGFAINAYGPSTVCQGGDVYLYVTGNVASCIWSDNSTNNYDVVYSAGTYCVTATDYLGCTATACIAITGGPNPTITPNGPTTFNQGGNVLLDAGVYSSYNWSTGDVLETIDVTSGGTYTVSVTDVNGCTGIASIVVTVNTSTMITPVIITNGSTTFCTGNSITLDAGGPYESYLWSNGSIDETISVSSSGNYSVTVTDNSGNTGTASQLVTVNSNPNPSITSNGATTFCNGGSVILDAGSFSSYSWSNNSNNETINVSNTGNYSVTITDGNHCTGIASQLVTVNSNPNPSITPNGATTFCEGGSVTLDAGSFSSYSWSNNSNNETINVSNTGNYSVTVTDGNHCTGITSQAVTVNTNPNPSITPNGATTFCEGGLVALDAGSFSSYSWSNNSNNETINVSTTGNYSVTVTDGNHCTGITSQAVTVNTNPIPSITPSGATTFCEGGSVTLDAGSFSSYSWSNNNNSETTSVSSTGNYSVTVTDGNHCTGVASQVVTVNQLPTPSITPNGATTFCNGGSVFLNAGSYSGYTWSNNSHNETIVANASGTYTVTVTDGNNCTGVASQSVTVLTVPTLPVSITGNGTVCHGSTNTYTISPVSGANNYTWTLPSGWVGSSVSTSITTTAGTIGGTISVTANNSCGNSTAAHLTITVNSGVPSQPGSITGNTSVCHLSSQTYTINPVSNSLNYLWALPSGWVGASTTTSITVTVGTTAGNITVKASNACGNSSQRTLNITTGNAPNEPGAITGNTTVCANTTQTYSVAAVNGATGFTWTLPSGWAGSSTTNSISLTTGSSSGSISVAAYNGCGTGTSRALQIAITQIPAEPSLMTGNTSVCSGSSQSYSVPAVQGATSYTWSLPSGWAGTSVIRSISTTAGISGGTISVKADNSCGSSSPRGLIVNSSSVPATPGVISGNTTVCKGSSQIYSISHVAGASSYKWTIPSGWNGTSITTSITATSGTSGGNITVKASNTCGTSAAQTLEVSVNAVTAVTITGNPANNNFCSQISPTSVTMVASSGFNSYRWSPGGGNTRTATVSSVNTYTVSATDGNGCTTSASHAVTNNCALPTALVNYNITGTAAIVKWTPSQCAYNYTIQIKLHNGNIWTPYTISPSSSYTFSGLAHSTSYDWQIQTNCNTSGAVNSGMTAIKTFTTTSNRMTEDESIGAAFSIYPNPADAEVTIAFSTLEEGSYSIKLVDMLGRVVKSEVDNANSGDNTYIMNLDGVAKGVYIVMLQHGDNISKAKLVVE